MPSNVFNLDPNLLEDSSVSYKNAMSIVRALGKPTLFITMTMDVNCPEVKAQLNPGETPFRDGYPEGMFVYADQSDFDNTPKRREDIYTDFVHPEMIK